MRVVYDGRLSVSYGQAYVEPENPDDVVDHLEDFAGQINGLLGAAQAGALYLTTGVHTGDVGLRVVIADGPVPLGSEWEDVVEATFVPEGPCVVMQWAGEGVPCGFELLPVPHRVRYSARGMDAGRDADVVMHDEPLVDHYELTFWPADPAPERIVRQGSRIAAYWHDARDHVKARRREIQQRWGDNPPSDLLIDVTAAQWLVRRRRDLAEQIAAAAPAAQRAVAYRAARRCAGEHQTESPDWITKALTHQARNEILPPGFERRPEVEEALRRTQEARVAALLHTSLPSPPGRVEPCPLDWVIAAILAADHEDPLVAALDALAQASHAVADTQALLDQAGQLAATFSASQPQSGEAPGPVAHPQEDPRHDPWHGDFMSRLTWGDDPPSPRLIEVYARELTLFDRPLAERIAAAAPDVQREIARWSARRACTASGLAAALPEVALALDHLDRGQELPPPFDSVGGEQWRLLDRHEPGDETAETGSTFSVAVFGQAGTEAPVHPENDPPETDLPAHEALEAAITVEGTPNWSRAHYTLGVIQQAAEPDPLKAATHALWTAACSFGDEYRRGVLKQASQLFFEV